MNPSFCYVLRLIKELMIYKRWVEVCIPELVLNETGQDYCFLVSSLEKIQENPGNKWAGTGLLNTAQESLE